MTEEEALRLLLDYLKKTGQGRWEGNSGPDPPDFIIASPKSNELAAVEHTRFFWPPEELTFDRALQSVKEHVNTQIRNSVLGLFGVSIDHQNREAFASSFKQLSRAKRRQVGDWLAGQIVAIGGKIGPHEEEWLDGPLRCLLIRYQDDGPGEMIWARSLSVGSDLGIRLQVRIGEGSYGPTFVERVDKADTVLSELEDVLRRKAEQLKSIDYGRRTLLVEYCASLRETLEYIMTVIDVPKTIDELYFLVFPGPEVVRWEEGRLGGGG